MRRRSLNALRSETRAGSCACRCSSRRVLYVASACPVGAVSIPASRSFSTMLIDPHIREHPGRSIRVKFEKLIDPEDGSEALARQVI